MAINDVAKMDALDFEGELVDAIEATGRAGLSYADAARILDLDHNYFRHRAQYLIQMGRIKLTQGYRGYRIVLPHWDDPHIYLITDRQRKALDFLCSQMDDDNLIRISTGKIFKATGVGPDAIDRLDYKGYLEILERGHSTAATLYRVYPDRSGPQGYTWLARQRNGADSYWQEWRARRWQRDASA